MIRAQSPILRSFVSLLGFALGSLPAAAGEVQSLASIRLQAEAFILQQPYVSPYPPQIKLGKLDSRLRLKPCPQTLSVEFVREDMSFGNTTLLVRCPQSPRWKIHLPVRIDLFDDVAVASGPLHKGQIIDTNTSRFEKRNLTRLKNGFYTQRSELTELQAKRNLARGTVLTSKNLSKRLLVRSGQTVTLVLNYKGLQIKTTGQALQSAGRGEPVRVRNSQSQKIVEGVVSGEALVQVGI